MGRSNIKQVAEKRRIDIEKFLVSLFRMADEIAHSDLVYTFFHSLLRDQEEASMGSIHSAKLKGKQQVFFKYSHSLLFLFLFFLIFLECRPKCFDDCV